MYSNFVNLKLVYSIKYRFPLKLLYLWLQSFQRLGCLSPSAVPLDLPTLNDMLKVLECFFSGGRQHSWTFGHWCCSEDKVRLCLHGLAAFPRPSSFSTPNLANKNRQKVWAFYCSPTSAFVLKFFAFSPLLTSLCISHCLFVLPVWWFGKSAYV